jgi:hypothetical protein
MCVLYSTAGRPATTCSSGGARWKLWGQQILHGAISADRPKATCSWRSKLLSCVYAGFLFVNAIRSARNLSESFPVLYWGDGWATRPSPQLSHDGALREHLVLMSCEIGAESVCRTKV